MIQSPSNFLFFHLVMFLYIGSVESVDVGVMMITGFDLPSFQIPIEIPICAFSNVSSIVFFFVLQICVYSPIIPSLENLLNPYCIIYFVTIYFVIKIVQ